MPQETAVNAPIATPTMPSAPPSEALKQNFSMDDMPTSDGGESKITIDKVEVKEIPTEVKSELKNETGTPPTSDVEKPVAKVEPKVEPKKEEKKSALKPPAGEVKKEAGKEVIKPLTPVKAKTESEDSFDYTKYAPAEVTNMKNMSRPSREAYAKLLDENKQLSSLKDATYLQHEQGYTLSPEYQQMQLEGYRAQLEAKCWEDSLLSIRAGGKFKEITGFDKNNNPVMSEEKTATDRDEIRLNNNLATCNNALRDVSGKLQQFPTQFKNRVTNDLQAIENEQANRFEWVKNPALLEHSVSIEGLGDVKVKDIKQNFKNLFPAYLANSKGVDVASNLMVAMQIQRAEMRELENQIQVLSMKNSEKVLTEPSSDHSPSAPPVTSINGKAIPAVFSVDGLPGR